MLARAALLLLALCASALAADTTPFYRIGEPNQLPAGTTPRLYEITTPAAATSYRFTNPCTVDIRIKTVGSRTEVVTASTGTLFLARTSEVMASSRTNMVPRLVSIMTLRDPGPTPCVPELHYGTGQ